MKVKGREATCEALDLSGPQAGAFFARSADLINNAQVTPVTPARKRTWESVAALFARALSAGGVRKNLTTVEWDTSGDCEAGVYREFHAVPTAKHRRKYVQHKILHADGWPEFVKFPADGVHASRTVTVTPMSRHPLTVEMTVRCRACKKCLAAKASHWRLRAQAECRAAVRTWFGTLTLNPTEQFLALARARDYTAKSGIDFDALSDGEKFAERVRAVGPAITKYLKRLRKQSGAKVRYLIVAEEHRSGAPHWHILLHEVLSAPVREALLSAEWKLGFCKWRLVKDHAVAGYVAKYISKTMLARVRASKDYGNPNFVVASPLGRSAPLTPPSSMRGLDLRMVKE